MPSFKLKSFSLILSVLILGGFYSYGLWAWTGPTSAPPGSNAPTPVNIGTSDQDKAGRLSATEFYDTDDSSFYINPSGDSKVSGTLSLGGDLYDVTNSKKIYDSATGKFDAAVMPYEKGDLTSDWATNTYSSGYYTPPSASDVTCGVTYGRGDEEGTACNAGYDCVSSACAPGEDICTYGHGPFELNGSNVFCSDGKMWSTTLAAGYEWGHYGSVVGNCTSSSDATYPACYACNTLDYAGFTDWYLPSKDVLLAVVGDIGLCPANGGTCNSWDSLCCTSSAAYPYRYWSSTEYFNNNAWYVIFTNGTVNYYTKNNSFSVRCVRP